MTIFRSQGTHCPLIAQARCHMNVCQPCRFFRGASTFTQTNDEGKPKLLPNGKAVPSEWTVACNWPRDGAYLAPEHRTEVKVERQCNHYPGQESCDWCRE